MRFRGETNLRRIEGEASTDLTTWSGQASTNTAETRPDTAEEGNFRCAPIHLKFVLRYPVFMLAEATRRYRHRSRWVGERLSQLRWSMPDGARGVALTFDDGPDPEFTPQVLDLLAAYDVKATFFLVGECATRHPALAQRIADAGHAVGSHSNSHVDINELSTPQVWGEYRTGRDVVSDVLGTRTTLFRPPKGYVGLGSSTVTRALGLRPWLWSLAGEDWLPGITAQEILDRIGKPVAGDVILLHDGLQQPIEPSAMDRSQMVAALRQLIPETLERGLPFVTL